MMKERNADIARVTRLDSSKASKAVGRYTHITEIKPGATLYTFSGQVGADMAGVFPEEFNRQVDNTFLNMANLLQSINITPDNVIKVNIWATEEIDWDYFYTVYEGFFGVPYPSMTVAYVSALGLKEIKLEIELWAAK